ncbi:hypothetical protein [Caryophanon tenue]|nr:hypothetical protein [Caryophanon tenue]
MIKKLAALIEVRKIVTLMFALGFLYLALTLAFAPSESLPIFTMVLGYYFAKSTALDGTGDSK